MRVAEAPLAPKFGSYQPYFKNYVRQQKKENYKGVVPDLV